MDQLNKTPKLRFPGFDGEWQLKNLEHFLSFKNGINADKERYGKGIKFINVLDIINNDYLTYERILGSVDIDDETFANNEVSYGDILFQRSSETREEVGQSNVYLDKHRKATFGGFVIRGKKVNDYNPFFMHSLLKTDLIREAITTKSGGSTRYNIGQETLKTISIYIPNLVEQEKIAQFLGVIDTKILQLSKKKALLEKYKTGVLEQIFTQQVRFKHNGNEYASWKIVKLDSICSIIKSGGTPTSTNKEYYDGEIPFLAISDMTLQGKYLNRTVKKVSTMGIDNSSSWIVPANSIIYSMYASVGFVSINKIPIATSQAVINLILKKGIYIEYIYYYLLYFKKFLPKYIEKGTQGNLNAQSVKNFDIELPEYEEQLQIANFLSEVDLKIAQVNQQILKSKVFKKGLLQKLFI
ncbi:restriction endonuclease subunit S [Mucilaginibacter flavidus]|uniref:restriction endonuclease subunit S n=1 Tax=Mucilaginibacter flavidus TaxID=2949309 RepID=UPI00209352E9|nr:restriction endonuclease subunit S [Mucilaginibacter flavidus]MCO5947938.1 restriction endonuclease subunit S [Mucilaginibacter flavidus]